MDTSFELEVWRAVSKFMISWHPGMASARKESVTSLFCKCPCDRMSETNCSMYGKLINVLQKYFSFSSFCDCQLEALLPLLHGRDVFVRMATGSGKSVSMFLGPLALSDSEIGVIISPLNGLMEQQVSIVLI